MMRQAITVRLTEDLLHLIEEVRDPKEHPTLSSFIRKAVETYARKMRRRKLAAECHSLAEEDLSPLAEADISDYAERMARTERGEL